MTSTRFLRQPGPNTCGYGTRRIRSTPRGDIFDRRCHQFRFSNVLQCRAFAHFPRSVAFGIPRWSYIEYHNYSIWKVKKFYNTKFFYNDTKTIIIYCFGEAHWYHEGLAREPAQGMSRHFIADHMFLRASSHISHSRICEVCHPSACVARMIYVSMQHTRFILSHIYCAFLSDLLYGFHTPRPRVMIVFRITSNIFYKHLEHATFEYCGHLLVWSNTINGLI